MEYNPALLESMMTYVDAVWEINVSKDTVYSVRDKITPQLNNRLLSMDEALTFVVENCHPKYKEQMEKCLSKEYLQTLEKPVKFDIKTLVNYRYHTIRCLFTPVVKEGIDNEIVYMTVQDVQDLLEKEESVSQDKAELDRYLTSVSCGVMQYTRDTHKLIYVNDVALGILGYSSMQEMQDDGFDGVVKTVNSEDSDKIKDLIKNIHGEDKTIECEYRVNHRDGKEIICIGRIRIIDRGDKEPLVQRSMIDVTSMRKASVVYKQVSDTLSVANMGLWYIILDDGAPKFYMDETVARLVGTPADTNPEKAYSIWYNTLTPDAKEIVNDTVLKIRNGCPAEATYFYNHPTRGKITIRCGGYKDTTYTGKGILMRGYHQDISEFNANLLEQIEVSKAAGKYYSGICEIDFAKGASKFISNKSGHFTNSVAKVRPIQSIMETLAEAVLEDSRSDFIKMSDNEYIINKLADTDIFSMSLNMKDGTYKVTFVVTGRDNEGRAERCILFAEG